MMTLTTSIQLPGRFRTAPPAGTRYNFTVALASCAVTGSRQAIFDAIRNDSMDLFLHMGDFHYEDIGCNCLETRLDAVHTVLASSQTGGALSLHGAGVHVGRPRLVGQRLG